MHYQTDPCPVARPATEAITVISVPAEGRVEVTSAKQVKKRGRPLSDNPKSPRAEYQRELMRQRRAKLKEGK